MNIILSISFVLLGGFAILGLYHLMVSLERKDFANFTYALYCFGISGILITQRIIPIIIQSYDNFLVRLFYFLSVHLTVWSMAYYMYGIYEWKKKIEGKLVNFIFIPLTLIAVVNLILALILKTYKYFFIYFIPLAIFGILYLVVLVGAFFHYKYYKNFQKLIIFLGFCLVIIISIYVSLEVSQNIVGKFSIYYVTVVINAFLYGYALVHGFNEEHFQLKYLTNTLEQKVLERTEQLKLANEQRINYFINLAHETKTPLTLISNYLDEDIKKRGLSNDLTIAKQNVDKLKRDMVNFLDIEKLERGQDFYRHDQIVNLTMLLRKKVLMFEEIAKRKNISIKSDIKNDIYTKIDPYAMDRIVNNLVDNAIRYTNENGKVTILAETHDKKIIITIRDTGIGISENDQKHIFEPYYQISHEKSNVQGIGMGLNITKKIIDDVDGEIEVKSRLGKETTFIIILNEYILTSDDKVQENIKFSAPIDNIIDINLKDEKYLENKNTIFIVEDNIQMLSYLQESLMIKYNVFYAKDGKEALEKLKNIPKPDLIISDIMMPEMDGNHFLEELNKNESYKSIPVVFLTAKTTQEEKIKGLSQGAVDYIYKPFEPEELLLKAESMIKMCIARRKEFSENLEDTKKEKRDLFYYTYNITNQEKQIVEKILEGKENKFIAGEMSVSLYTVKNHVQNIFQKTGIKSRMELRSVIETKYSE